MQHPTKYIIKQSLTLAAKWRSHKATWARFVTITSTLHVLMFYANLIRTMYTLKYTISCSTYDYRYSIYILFLNLVALWPICPATQRDEDGRRRIATINEEPLILCSTTNLVTSFLAIPLTSMCFYQNLLSPLDFGILMAGHSFAILAVYVHRCYAKCSDIAEIVAQRVPTTEEHELESQESTEQEEQATVRRLQSPVLSTLKPIRKTWFRLGYLFRVLFLVLTYIAYMNMPSTEQSCPVHPAATYLSHTASVTLLLTIMNELADDECKFISVYRNVLDRRQYVVFSFHRYMPSMANYKFHLTSAMTFTVTGFFLFLLDFMSTADFYMTALGSACWIVLHTLSCICFSKFFDQVMDDHIKIHIAKHRAAKAAKAAEEGRATDEVTDDTKAEKIEPEKKKEDDGSFLI